jgi:hypothetical protein
MSFLQNLLGNQQQQQDYQDFVNRYEQGHPSQGYSDQEVWNRYQQVAPQLPPQQYQQAALEAVNRLSPQERAQLGQYLMQQAQQQGASMPGLQQGGNLQNPNALAGAMAQMHQQQPDVLQNLFGKGGALGNPLAKAAVAGIAAMAAKQFLSGQGGL